MGEEPVYPHYLRAILYPHHPQEQSMLHVKPRFLAAALVLLGSAPASAQGTVAGAWELTLETPQGANTVNLKLDLDGDKLSGELSSPLGTTPITGTTAGDDAKWTANIEIQGMALALGFAAKLAGDTLNGTVKLGDFGDFPFTGKRPTATATTPPAASAAPAGDAAVAAGSGVTGTWAIVLTLEGLGEFPATANFKQEGDQVSGTFTSQAGAAPVKGTLTGTALNLEMTAESPQGPIVVTLTGDVAGSTITGKASLAGIGEASWKGTRQ